jgi:hypothetical protein
MHPGESRFNGWVRSVIWQIGKDAVGGWFQQWTWDQTCSRSRAMVQIANVGFTTRVLARRRLSAPYEGERAPTKISQFMAVYQDSLISGV